jgi:hypothetical protein
VVAALFWPLAVVVNLAGFAVGMMLVTSSCRSETGKGVRTGQRLGSRGGGQLAAVF